MAEQPLKPSKEVNSIQSVHAKISNTKIRRTVNKAKDRHGYLKTVDKRIIGSVTVQASQQRRLWTKMPVELSD